MLSIKFPHNLSKTLDRAIARLENGESVEHIVASSPSAMRGSLKEFLSIAAELRGIRLAEVPPAHRSYAFLNHSIEKASRFARVMRSLRTGYAISGAFALLLVAGVSTAAANSLPGSPLFSLKRTFEIAQIKVVPHTPGDRAQLELALADRRLADAQQVFSDTSSDASDKASALQELDSQTQVALNQIQQVASTPTITGNPGIIQKLVNLTQTQASLQAQVDPNASSSATTQNQKTLAAIQESVASATNTQSSATIASKQQADATGVITTVSTDSITVDKNVFQIGGDTQFLSAAGLQLKETDLHIGDTVAVIGIIAGENNQAQIITLKEKAVVQPAQNPTSTPTAPTSSGSIGDTIPTTIQPSAPDVTGGFILESSTPQ